MSYIGAQPTTAAFVTDQFSGDGSTTVFTMSVAPANTASVIVAVSGVLQDPSTYAVSGTSLTFSGTPPAGSGNISARYLGLPASGVATTAYRTLTEFTATSGQTTFSVPSYTVGFINVYRNGVMLGTADFTATSGTTVVLAAGATTGDLVAAESFYVSGVSNAIPAVAGAVNTSYITDGAVTQAKLGVGVGGNKLLRITRYTTAGSGTWTKPSDTVSVLIRTIAGGGGGGGGSGGVFAGGGGASGGYAEIYIATAASSYAYVVGAGGAGGSGAGQNGNAGSATTIAGIASGAGAAGGTGAAGYGGNGGIGVVPTGGNLNVRGASGNSGDSGDAAQSNGSGGMGGSGVWGGSGRGAGFNSPIGGVGVFGGGGGGGASASAGGAGGAGYIEIWEYS